MGPTTAATAEPDAGAVGLGQPVDFCQPVGVDLGRPVALGNTGPDRFGNGIGRGATKGGRGRNGDQGSGSDADRGQAKRTCGRHHLSYAGDRQADS